jgi:hypothetical protein
MYLLYITCALIKNEKNARRQILSDIINILLYEYHKTALFMGLLYIFDLVKKINKSKKK